MHIIFLLAAAYVFTPVVVPGENVVAIFGINDHEQTMVTTDLSSGTYRHGTYTRLTPPAGYQLTGTGINNAGVITGVAIASDGSEHGFVLRDSVYTFFSRPGWTNTEPRAIGNSALITGLSFNSDLVGDAGFLYDPASGTFTDVTPPGSTLTIAQGINKFGRIAGSGRQLGIGRYAFVWQQGQFEKGKHEFVPFLERSIVGDGSTNGRGINDAGVIVGYTTSGGTSAGFVGNASRGYELLLPPGATDADALTTCQGINNDNQVVCAVVDVAGNVHAFIGSPQNGEGDER
jgi:hypothetical protein